MLISLEALEKLGVELDESKSPVEVFLPNNISQSTQHDLWIAFEGKLKIHSIDSSFTQKTSEVSQRDAEIFS